MVYFNKKRGVLMKIKTMILTALFAILMAVGARITLPLPLIPVTLQTLFCILAGVLLGKKWGAYSQLLYIVMGLIGLPMFTQGGGLGYVVHPTFGYLLGFVCCAYLTGFLCERLEKNGRLTKLRLFFVSLISLVPIYLFGVTYLYFIKNIYLQSAASLGTVLYSGFLLTIGGDVLTCALVALFALKVRKAIQSI